MRILLIEDDPMIGGEMHGALVDACYATDWCKDGASGLLAAKSEHYDLVLLDLGLPRKDGHDVLAAMRASGHRVPVLIVTARDAVDERIRGLDSGADDYIIKPFHMDELLARMRTVLRRSAGRATPILSNGELSLDPTTHMAQRGNAEPILLSAREFSLLQALLERPGAILSRQELEDRIYGWGEEIESNAIEFFIHTLRRKLGRDAIKNVRGVGWMASKGT